MEKFPPRWLVAVWFVFTGFIALAQQIGDSPDTVAAALGQPSLKRTSGERETWIYPGGKKLVFVNGRLAEQEVNEREARVSAQQKEQTQIKERQQSLQEAIKSDLLPLGSRRWPGRALFIGVAILGALLYAGANSLPATNRKAGVVIFGLVAVLTMTSLALDVHITGVIQELLETAKSPIRDPLSLYTTAAVGVLITGGMLYFMARGSSWAFGVFCLGFAPGLISSVLMLRALGLWFLIVPFALKAVAIALLLTAPVQGFLNRHHKSVAETIRELDRGNLAANKRKK